ncbi:MAG: formyltransferase family protein [Devosia sp.]
MAKAEGFIFCMTDAEAAFFRSMLCGRAQWSCAVTSSDALSRAMALRPQPTRLISFSSDPIIPAQILNDLNGQCFNFHSGPPERPGFRPTAFAIPKKAANFGVTFHLLTAKIDAGPIYATQRFPLPANATQETTDVLVYQQLIALAKDLAGRLAEFDAAFVPNGEAWTGRATTRADYERLHSSPSKGLHYLAQ